MSAEIRAQTRGEIQIENNNDQSEENNNPVDMRAEIQAKIGIDMIETGVESKSTILLQKIGEAR